MPPVRILLCVRPVSGGLQEFPIKHSSLETALQMVYAHPNIEITALTTDEPGGEAILRTCLSFVAVRGVLTAVPKQLELDLMALAHFMAGAIQELERISGPFDAILCGDNDPDQDGLGPALAGCLGRPQATGVFAVSPGPQGFRVWRDWNMERSCLKVPSPCVLSILPLKVPPRYPDLLRMAVSNWAELPILAPQAQLYVHTTVSFPLRPRSSRMFYEDDPHMIESLIEQFYKVMD